MLAGGAVAREEVPHAGLADAEIDRPDVRHDEAAASQIIGKLPGQGGVPLVARDVMDEDPDLGRGAIIHGRSLAGPLEPRRARRRLVGRRLRRSVGLGRSRLRCPLRGFDIGFGCSFVSGAFRALLRLC